MRILILVTIVLFPLMAMTAPADSLFYETGGGFLYSTGSTANFLRYRHETTPLFGYSSYYEASYASWNGPDHDNAVGLARGIRWAGTDDDGLTFTAGVSHIRRTTDNLGQPFEFYLRLAYEKNIGKALLSVGWIHYSDGKFIFGWSGPNDSENFATVSVGMHF